MTTFPTKRPSYTSVLNHCPSYSSAGPRLMCNLKTNLHTTATQTATIVIGLLGCMSPPCLCGQTCAVNSPSVYLIQLNGRIEPSHPTSSLFCVYVILVKETIVRFLSVPTPTRSTLCQSPLLEMHTQWHANTTAN